MVFWGRLWIATKLDWCLLSNNNNNAWFVWQHTQLCCSGVLLHSIIPDSDMLQSNNYLNSQRSILIKHKINLLIFGIFIIVNTFENLIIITSSFFINDTFNVHYTFNVCSIKNIWRYSLWKFANYSFNDHLLYIYTGLPHQCVEVCLQSHDLLYCSGIWYQWIRCADASSILVMISSKGCFSQSESNPLIYMYKEWGNSNRNLVCWSQRSWKPHGFLW